jgi:hypothetical protein
MDVCVHRAVSKFDEVDVARALLGMYGKLDKRALAPSSALTRDVALRVLAKALRVCDVNGDDSLAEKIGGEAFKLLMSQDELLGLIGAWPGRSRLRSPALTPHTHARR